MQNHIYAVTYIHLARFYSLSKSKCIKIIVNLLVAVDYSNYQTIHQSTKTKVLLNFAVIMIKSQVHISTVLTADIWHQIAV